MFCIQAKGTRRSREWWILIGLVLHKTLNDSQSHDLALNKRYMIAKVMIEFVGLFTEQNQQFP
jgi:hypothetical protein